MEVKDILLGVAAVGSAVLSGYTFTKVKELNDKLDEGIDTIAKACEGQIDISDTIIEKAVDRAVEKQARDASERALHKIDHEIADYVHKVVDEAYDSVKGDVKRELDKQVQNVDIKSIQRKVVDEAAEKAQEKFKSDLDDILKQYNKKLDDVGTIYDSIAASLKGREKNDGGLNVKIGG